MDETSLPFPSKMRSEHFAHIPEGDRKCRGIGLVCNHKASCRGGPSLSLGPLALDRRVKPGDDVEREPAVPQFTWRSLPSQ